MIHASGNISCYGHVGAEIWKQTDGEIDAFVSGSGTGGTLAGVSHILKKKNPRVKVYLSDPPGSSLYNKVNGTCITQQ